MQLTAGARTALAVSSHVGNLAGSSSLQHPVFTHINDLMSQQLNTDCPRCDPVSPYPSPFKFRARSPRQ